MPYQSHSVYEQENVLHASPERLVQLLYELGIQSLASARERNREKDIRGRVHHINKAFAVLVELSSGLDFERGGEVATNYSRLYDYCQRKLIEANVKQSDAMLAEVESLLIELKEAWQFVLRNVSAERSATLLSGDVLPMEEALAGSVSVVG